MGTETLVRITEDKKIKLEPIVRGRPFFKKGHDGEFMFTGCKQRFTLPFLARSGSYAKIFTKEEQKAFEKELNRPEGSLSLYNRKSEFWDNFWVEIGKEGLALDLNNPVHALQFRIVKANKDHFAPTWKDRFNRPSYKFAIVDNAVIEEEENKNVNKLQEAMELYTQVKNSKQKMSNILRLLDKKLPVTADKEWLSKEILKIISQKSKIKGLSNIDDFIKAANDPQVDAKIFILDAIEAKTIVAENGSFRQVDNNLLIGRSLQDVVDHYNDPEYQEDKILIQEKIKRFNRN